MRLHRASCKDLQLPHVKNCISTEDLWDTLKKIHVTNYMYINVHYYFEELYTQKYVNYMPMAGHIAAILDLKSQIQDAGDVESTKLTTDIVSTNLQSEANCGVCAAVGGSTALYAQRKILASVMASQIHSMHAMISLGHDAEDDCPYSQKNIKMKTEPQSTNLMTL
jgi:hypothetical protein